MTDTLLAPTTPLPTAPAPSTGLLNAASFSRLAMAILGTWLTTHAGFNPTDAQTLAGAALILVAAGWNLYKNSTVAKNLAAALTSPAVRLVAPQINAMVTKATPTLVAIFLIAPVLAGGLFLQGCANILTNTPVTPTNSQGVVIAASDFGFETTYNYAARQYLELAPSLTPATKAQVKAIFAKLLTCPTAGTMVGCTGYVAAAHQAALVGDQTTLTAQIAQIVSLATQVTKLLGVAAPPT